ncbi:potassium channel family protein [Evansella cellulosilytica]|uniref:potassium channel family protein n=1 Tax=Evansella cellulosilytica TaxID=1413 RepID=UPI0018DEE73F|nr:potassium channel family protein [Evansella cellulosilytica]
MFRFDFIVESYSRFYSLIKMTFIVFLFALFIGNLMHIIEPDNFPSIFDGIWWSVVTISTVGYGDFVPESIFGRILGIILILGGIALFSFFITNLASSTVLAKQEKDAGGAKVKEKGHYIIVGWNERSHQLIKELMNLYSNIHIVLIDETLEKKPIDTKALSFVKGSPTKDETYERANIKKAHTIIITSNQHVDEKTSDANTVLTLLTSKGMQSNIYAIVELISPQQAKNAERAGADEVILSSKHLSLLMVNGVLFHGMTDVIAEMLKHGKDDQLQFKIVPPELINETFQKAITDYQTSDMFLIGIRRGSDTLLHPKNGSQLLSGDKLIFFKRVSS